MLTLADLQPLFTVSLLKELDELDVVIVVAAGDTSKQGSTTINSYPSNYERVELPNVIVVGATEMTGNRLLTSPLSSEAGEVTTYLVGHSIPAAHSKNDADTSSLTRSTGTSISKFGQLN